MASAPPVMCLARPPGVPGPAPTSGPAELGGPQSPQSLPPILRPAAGAATGELRRLASEGDGRIAAAAALHSTRPRHKSVNFFLETPYQTLSNVRSHCLVESRCSTDKIHTELAMLEIRAATLSTAVYNILFSMSGPVVLVIPGLFQRTSWWGLLLLALIGYGMHHASQCVTRFVLDDPLLLTYRHVGTKVFGAGGSYLVLALQVVNYGAAALILLRLGVDNLAILFLHGFPDKPPMAYDYLVCLGTFLTLPFLFLRALDNIGVMSLLGYLSSLVAVFCMAAAVTLALRSGVIQAVTQHHPGHLEGLLSASTVFCFGFGGHMYLVFPGLLGVMRHPPDYKVALRIAFSCKLVSFSLFPAFCFYAFGGDVQQNVLYNLPPGYLTTVALFLMTSQCIFLVAVVLSPLFYLTELYLGIEQEGEHRQKLPEVVSRCIMRTILAGSLALLTLQMWRKGLTLVQLIQLFGGSTVLLSAWLLPIGMYLKHYGPQLPVWQQLHSMALMALGCTIFGFNLNHTVVPAVAQLTRSAVHTEMGPFPPAGASAAHPHPLAGRSSVATDGPVEAGAVLENVFSSLPMG